MWGRPPSAVQQAKQAFFGLQLPAQHPHHLPNRFFIPAIPAPLPLLRGLDESSPGENRHMMGNRWLGKMYAFFDLSPAKTWRTGGLVCVISAFRSNFQHQQDAASRRVGDSMQGSVEGCFGRHGGIGISRKSMNVNLQDPFG